MQSEELIIVQDDDDTDDADESFHLESGRLQHDLGLRRNATRKWLCQLTYVISIGFWLVWLAGIVVTGVRIIQDGGLVETNPYKLAFIEEYGYVDVYLMNCTVELVVCVIIFLFLISSVIKFLRTR